jgi:hypothetical protein
LLLLDETDELLVWAQAVLALAAPLALLATLPQGLQGKAKCPLETEV